MDDPSETAGNISIDPNYFNPANRQYQLRSGSPAIDSAHGDAAPTTDRLGNPRFDDPNVFNTGIGSIPFVDRGAMERQQISVSNTDLETVAVAGPAAGVQDDDVMVGWTVQNIGSEPATGSWRDRVYLSVDPVWTPDDLLLGEFDHVGTLGPGQTYAASGVVKLPGLLPGPYSFIVRADARNEVFEGLKELNNAAAASDTISVDLPSLFLDQPVQGQLQSTGDMTYFKVTTPAAADLLLDLTGPAGSVNEIYASFGRLPTRQNFDYRGIRPDTANQTISFGNTRAGAYYVLVYGADVPSAETFSLTASLSGFGITSVTPVQGSNLGQVTVSIRGAQFDANSLARLIDSDGNQVDASRVHLTDSGLIHATFDLTGSPTGLADMQVINTGDVITTLPDAFQILEGVPGRLEVNVIAPARIRLARNFEITVQYSNQGETDVLAPVMQLRSHGLSELSYSSDRIQSAAALPIIGVNSHGPAGVLPPGTQHELTFYGRSTDVGAESFDLSLDLYPDGAIDWTEVESIIRPMGLPDETWQPIFAALQVQIGDSWSDYRQAVSNAATLLPTGDGMNHSFTDVFSSILQDALAAVTTSLSGRLYIGSDTQPLSNAEVRLFDPNQSLGFSARSRTDGSFVIPGLEAGVFDVFVDGYAPLQSTQITVDGSDPEPLNLVVTPAAQIHGSVLLASSGQPLRNVDVRALGPDGSVHGTQTDQYGTYSIGSLPPAEYRIQAGGGIYPPGFVDNIVLGQGEVRQNLNLTLQAGAHIDGTVTGLGGPVADAVVAALGADGTGKSTTTDENGQYAIPGVSGQSYTVSVSADDLVAQHVEEIALATHGSLSGIDFHLLQGGGLAGQVSSLADGVSIAGVQLLFANTAGNVFPTLSQADGTYQIAELPEGDYTWSTRSGQFMSSTGDASVVAGTSSQLDIAIAPRGTITGTVTNSTSGVPLAHVTVYATDGQSGVVSATTDETGAYSLAGLDAGIYRVRLGDTFSPGLVSTEVVIDSSSTSETADFVTEVGGIISGTVFGSDGITPAEQGRVMLIQNGESVIAMPLESDGGYSFVVIADGTYDVAAATQGWIYPVVSNLNVAGGSILNDINFTPGSATVTGVVQAPDGTLLSGAEVFLARPGTDPLTVPVVADEIGQFRFFGVPSGDYELTSHISEYGRRSQLLTVPAGGTTADLTVVPGGALFGTVQSSAARLPLAETLITAVGVDDGVVFSATSSATGDFRLVGLPAGDYDITFTADDHETVIRSVRIVSEQAQELNLALAETRALVSGNVRHGTHALEHAAVLATDENGIVVASATTDADGAYVLNTLAQESTASRYSGPVLAHRRRLQSPSLQEWTPLCPRSSFTRWPSPIRKSSRSSLWRQRRGSTTSD